MKVLSALVLLGSFIYANLTTYISHISNDVYIKNIEDIEVGSSGILIREHDKSHSSIYARVSVIKKTINGSVIKLFPFNYIKQNVLPTPVISPKIGDTVVLNYMYKRVLPIVKNANSYNKLIQNQDIEFTHPDIFSSYMYINSTNKPTRQDFSNICSANSIGLVLFEIHNFNYFVDCFSFKLIKKEPLEKVNDTKTQLPFYSRIKKAGKSFWNSKNNYSFDKYYLSLIKQ